MRASVNPEYVANVRRFGSSRPYEAVDGREFNLSHKDVFAPDAVKTDGAGNVTEMPLLRRKPCFGRPERFVRGALEQGKPFGVPSADGTQARGLTRCDSCPVLDACSHVADERIETSAPIRASFHAWMDACDHSGHDRGSPFHYLGKLGALWRAYLDAIIAHGGWSNVNDDNCSLHEQQIANDRKARRNAARRAQRAQKSAMRAGKVKPITQDYLDALDRERDRRAHQLRQIRKSAVAGPWLKKLPDLSCDRIAGVWAAIQLLERAGEKVTGKRIAEQMTRHGKSYGLSPASLTSRALEDRKRIARLEDDTVSSPLWPAWQYDRGPAAQQGGSPRENHPVKLSELGFNVPRHTP